MIFKLAWRNIIFKPLNTLLSVVLLTASVAIITLLILLQNQFEDKFNSNIEGVDLVLGAKGSPLQLILSSVYQVDAPTGNISFDSAKVWMEHQYVEKAIPLAFGDNYKGFKILGTTTDYLEKYQLTLNKGKLFKHNFDVVVGSQVAEKLNLNLGDAFFGAHGHAEQGEVHDSYAYKVVGIANESGKVADNLILCNIPSVWQMHAGQDHDHDHDHDHEAEFTNPPHGEEGHVHSDDEEHDHGETVNLPHGEEGHIHSDYENDMSIDTPNMDITSVLIKFRNKMGFVMWPNIIAQNTNMQAASPAVEINRLFTLFGVGITGLQYLAYAIMFISGLSIFIALYNTLKERKYEFALLRVQGAKRSQLLILVLLESILLCIVGFIFGTILGRVGLYVLSTLSESEFKMNFDPFVFHWKQEGLLLIITLLVGVLAAAIPAIKAYTLNLSKTLANA
jgi:putative ABC transport system permease protein